MAKPRAVLRAEWALWAWTAWTTLLGIYQLYQPLDGTAKDLVAQAEAIAGVTLDQVRPAIVGAYILAALSMVWVILRLGAGKRWARTTVLVTFVLEALLVLGDLGGPLRDILVDVPNIALQLYALVLVYTEPGRSWFRRPSVTRRLDPTIG